MRFVWDQKYSVGIKSIDLQHQRFFEIINEVNYLIYSHQTDLEKLKKVLSELLDYAEMHLKYEEDIFREIGYSDTEDHCNSHNAYRIKVEIFKLALSDKNGDLVKLAREMADFAAEWLSAHIMAEDTKYTGEFLRNDVK